MSQIFTLDRRESNPRHDLESNADEVRVPAQGDFARGQRRDIGRGRVACDFATGMRTSRRRMTLGDFATGMRTGSAPVVADTPSTPVSTLAVAA